jgi:hypothetical protein
MRMIGCDLRSRQQTLAMLDTTTGDVASEAEAEKRHLRKLASQI